MSRYIDADEALRMIRNSKRDCPLADDKRSIWDVAHNCCISCVEALPTADVVEVVRCYQCEWWKDKTCTNVNGARGFVPNGYWYCASGERKDDGT